MSFPAKAARSALADRVATRAGSVKRFQVPSGTTDKNPRFQTGFITHIFQPPTGRHSIALGEQERFETSPEGAAHLVTPLQGSTIFATRIPGLRPGLSNCRPFRPKDLGIEKGFQTVGWSRKPNKPRRGERECAVNPKGICRPWRDLSAMVPDPAIESLGYYRVVPAGLVGWRKPKPGRMPGARF